jgi:hypothetical protein
MRERKNDMSGSLDDIGSIPRAVANKMVEELLQSKDTALIGLSLDDCRAVVKEADLTHLTANDLSDGETDGLAELLFEGVKAALIKELMEACQAALRREGDYLGFLEQAVEKAKKYLRSAKKD